MSSRPEVILVSGAAGWLGRRFSEHCSDIGIGTFRLDVPGAFGVKSSNIIEIDLANPEKGTLKAALSGALEGVSDQPVGLVNFAGLVSNSPIFSFVDGQLASISPAEWHRVATSNYFPSINITLELSRLALIKKLPLSVVQISSVSARGVAGQSAYAAGKAALESATRSLALELGPLGMRFNSIRLGFVDSPAMKGNLSGERQAEVLSRTGTRQYVTLDSLFDAILEVLRNDSINGSVINLDGGYD